MNGWMKQREWISLCAAFESVAVVVNPFFITLCVSSEAVPDLTGLLHRFILVFAHFPVAHPVSPERGKVFSASSTHYLECPGLVFVL